MKSKTKKIIFPLLITLAIAGGTFMGLGISGSCKCSPFCLCNPCNCK